MTNRFSILVALPVAIALMLSTSLLAQDEQPQGVTLLQQSFQMGTMPPMAPEYEPLVGTVDPSTLLNQDEEILWAAPPTRELPWMPSWPSYASSFTVGRLTSQHAIPERFIDAQYAPPAQPPTPLGEPQQLQSGPRSRVMEFNRQSGKLEDANVTRW